MLPTLPPRDLCSSLPEFCERHLKPDSFYAKLRKFGNLIAPEEDFEDLDH